MPEPPRKTTLRVLLVCSLLLPACTNQTSSEHNTPSSSSAEPTKAKEKPHGYVEGAEELSEPLARLAVFDSVAQELTLLNTDDGATIFTEAGITAAGNDARYLTVHKENEFDIIDGGVWTVDHGDHKHYYAAPTTKIGSISGDKPGRTMSNDGKLALFFEGSGDITVLDRNSLGEKQLKPLVSITGQPHQGLAVPFSKHIISTQAADSTEARPNSILAFDDSGNKVPLVGQNACSGIQNAGAVKKYSFFTCANGILTVDTDLTARLVNYPAEKTGTPLLSNSRNLVVVPFAEGGLGIFNPDDGSWVLAATQARFVSAGISPNSKRIFAVDTNGIGYSIHPTNGQILTEKSVISAPDPAHPPAVSTGNERSYVSDYPGKKILEIDVADDLRTARSFDVNTHPTELMTLGR